jgi:hypothetical protein
MSCWATEESRMISTPVGDDTIKPFRHEGMMISAESLCTCGCGVDSSGHGEFVYDHLPCTNVERVMAPQKLGDPQILVFVTNACLGPGTTNR